MPMPDTYWIDNGNPWGHPHAARAICPDGRTRVVRLNQAPDNAFAWPARGRASTHGPEVRGYVGKDSDGELRFHPYLS